MQNINVYVMDNIYVCPVLFSLLWCSDLPSRRNVWWNCIFIKADWIAYSNRDRISSPKGNGCLGEDGRNKWAYMCWWGKQKYQTSTNFSGNLLLCQPVAAENKFSINTRKAICLTVKNMLDAKHAWLNQNHVAHSGKHYQQPPLMLYITIILVWFFMFNSIHLTLRQAARLLMLCLN